MSLAFDLEHFGGVFVLFHWLFEEFGLKTRSRFVETLDLLFIDAFGCFRVHFETFDTFLRKKNGHFEVVFVSRLKMAIFSCGYTLGRREQVV